jgi:cytochrome c oxidase subunit 1
MFFEKFPTASRITKSCMAVAFIALGIGGFFGLLQALHRTGVYDQFINAAQYYTILTGHGVLLALVFTSFFITALFTWAVTRSLETPLRNPWFSWTWFGTMLLGTVLAGSSIFGGLFDIGKVLGHQFQADVLYTFYAPLKAHPFFYIGAALLIVGTWLAGLDWFRSYWKWRGENPDERIPLQTFMVHMTMLMWYLSTLGVALEVLVFLIPWSLNLIDKVDPLLTRTMFWYFGHPVVYFWLLPGYLVWYTILPKLSGGRLFSDPLARVVFILFLLLSTPVGFHHQYVDPGISEGFKFLAMTNTMFLLLPSLLTAFTVIASIEYGARQRGGKGYFSWVTNLPWAEPAFAGCMLAGLMFAAGGFSGMINAGMNINYLVHNTLWVPGHFHLTVGTAVALTFMAISYWLLPQLTGKELSLKSLASLQPYIWFIGMTLMSNAMHRAGMAGVPRRTADPTYRNVSFEGVIGGVTEMRWQIGIGGTLLFVSLLMFLTVITVTWLSRQSATLSAAQFELPAALSGPQDSPKILDNMTFWFVIAVLLVVIAYGIPIWSFLADGALYPGSTPMIP